MVRLSGKARMADVGTLDTVLVQATVVAVVCVCVCVRACVCVHARARAHARAASPVNPWIARGFASLFLGPCQAPWHLVQCISRVSELLRSQRLPSGGGPGELGRAMSTLPSQGPISLGMARGRPRRPEHWLRDVFQEVFREDLS